MNRIRAAYLGAIVLCSLLIGVVGGVEIAGCTRRGAAPGSAVPGDAVQGGAAPGAPAGAGGPRPASGARGEADRVAVGPEAGADGSLTLASPYYTLTADADRRADAELLAGTLDAAIARLIVDFAMADADGLLRAATVTIRVASSADDRCGPGRATNLSSWDGPRCTAEIHLLAPSAHPDPASPGAPRTSMDEPMDAAYVQRVLVHEYATVLLESIVRAKGEGWSFWDAPAWFVQGAEEYLGVMYSTPHARDVTLELYRRRTRDGSLVTGDWGVDAKSPYVSGPVLVAFIVDEFGRDAFVEILRSGEPTFGSAVRAELGCGPDEFYRLFRAWLDAAAPGATSPADPP